MKDTINILRRHQRTIRQRLHNHRPILVTFPTQGAQAAIPATAARETEGRVAVAAVSPQKEERAASACLDCPLNLAELPRVEQILYDRYGSWTWWQRFFFRHIYLPFVRFSFDYIKIPAMTERDADGRFRWHEDEGTYTDWESARAVCKGEFWRVKKTTLNGTPPVESVQIPGRQYPNGKKPLRYAKPSFSSIPKPVAEINQEHQAIAEATAIVDNINRRLRIPVSL